ncbi:hypothetical protein GS489_00290 [Rhodococcus hoagii]|nr:hypothetical protein [Prescottella equi]
MQRTVRYAGSTLVIATAAALLAGCASSTTGTAEQPTAHSSTSTTARDAEAEPTSLVSTPAVSSAAVQPGVEPPRLRAADVADLSDLTAVSAVYFTGNGSGALAGTRFRTPNGDATCRFTPTQGTCFVDSPRPWRAEDWCAVNGNDTLQDSNTVGWGNPPRPYTQSAQHCALQGTDGLNPNLREAPLEIGTKTTILLSFTDQTSVTCGSRDAGLTCVLEPNADHGFHISDSDYLTW